MCLHRTQGSEEELKAGHGNYDVASQQTAHNFFLTNVRREVQEDGNL
jgi:hypothetical protein